MSSRYNAADIEVLSGLDPVKRRPARLTTLPAVAILAASLYGPPH